MSWEGQAEPLSREWRRRIEEDQDRLVFLELVGLIDPVRPVAREACQDAGIRVMMITGNHPRTARQVVKHDLQSGEFRRLLLAWHAITHLGQFGVVRDDGPRIDSPGPAIA